MNVKNWKTGGIRDGEPVELYVETDDETITKDLTLGPMSSLTLMGRRHTGRHNPTQETDHFDFARGAFKVAAHFHKIELHEPISISQVDSVPDGLRAYPLGGNDKGFLATVYEEAVAEKS
jgi:hypothetical protein